MPLVKSPTKEAFRQNVKAGKPVKQSAKTAKKK
jgi:hypothetical protein